MQAVIETTDMGAKTARAAAASIWVGIAAIRSRATAPDPASPCRTPIPKTQCQDHDPDRALRARGEPVRQPGLERDEGNPTASRVIACPAPHQGPRRAASRVSSVVGGDERGDGGAVEQRRQLGVELLERLVEDLEAHRPEPS